MQLPAVVPSIVEKSYKYVSLFTVEAAQSLVEGHDWEHVVDLADPAEVSIDRSCHVDVSEAAHTAARRVVSKYWFAHRREEAR